MMSRILHRTACILFALTASLSLMNCSGKKIDDADPADLYKMAEEDIASDQYLLALDKLKMVRNKYPYSKYSTLAQLRIADVYYMQDSYAEAAAAYEAFRDLHPKHERAPYAMFRTAESYFKDIPSPISRDITPAKKAEEAFNEFLKRFPGDPQADPARGLLNEARGILAEKELYIANFYMKQDQFESAKRRYEKLLLMYPETKHAQEARDKLALAEKELTKTNP
jgi:outer membrane protein assembly factor BamD